MVVWGGEAKGLCENHLAQCPLSLVGRSVPLNSTMGLNYRSVVCIEGDRGSSVSPATVQRRLPRGGDGGVGWGGDQGDPRGKGEQVTEQVIQREPGRDMHTVTVGIEEHCVDSPFSLPSILSPASLFLSRLDTGEKKSGEATSLPLGNLVL